MSLWRRVKDHRLTRQLSTSTFRMICHVFVTIWFVADGQRSIWSCGDLSLPTGDYRSFSRVFRGWRDASLIWSSLTIFMRSPWLAALLTEGQSFSTLTNSHRRNTVTGFCGEPSGAHTLTDF
jgi:hypothetical protein